MPFTESDIQFYKSGVTGDNLGGVIHVDTISPDLLHNVFNIISATERTLGKVKHRCLYMKNLNATITALNPKLFIPNNTDSSGTELWVGWQKGSYGGVGNGTSSGIAQAMGNETTNPDDVQFTNATEVNKGKALGLDIPPLNTIPLWLRLIININTEKTPVDGCDIFIEFGNEVDDTGIPDNPVDTNIPVIGETDMNELFKKIMERIRLRFNISSLMMLGNTGSSADPTAWINMLGFLKDRTSISFGPRDYINPTQKNKLITALSTNRNTKGLGYSYEKINNVYCIYMDVTQPFENPSAQYDFIVKHLDLARGSSKIDFIIVSCNKAFYATLAANDETAKIDDRLRRTYHQLFADKGVHVVLQGQFRNYQRHKILSYNDAATDSPGEFNTGAPNYVISTGQKYFAPEIGNLYIGQGSSGMRPIHTPATLKSYTNIVIPLSNANAVGYMWLTATMRTADKSPKLTGTYYEYYRPVSLFSLFQTRDQEIQRDQWSITIQ